MPSSSDGGPGAFVSASGAGLVDDVEGGLGGAAETGKAGSGDDVADFRLARLRPEAEANFLGSRTGRTQQRGERIVHAADGIEVVFELVVGKGFDDHPCSAGSEGLTDVAGGADGIAHIVEAIEDRDKVIILAGKLLGFCDVEGDAAGKPLLFRGRAGSGHRLVVVVEAMEFRLG